MQNFVYYAPTEVIFGKDAEAQTAAAVSRWNGSRVLIVYGGGSVRRLSLIHISAPVMLAMIRDKCLDEKCRIYT